MAKKKHNTAGGGALPNKHALWYEEYTDLEEALRKAGFDIREYETCKKVFNGLHQVGLVTKKYGFYKTFDHLNNNKWKQYISKRLLPDDVFVNTDKKIVFIIEKKYQEDAGSVDEKLQTVDFKIKEYQKMLPGWEVRFIYLLNDYFDKDCYHDVFDYIRKVGGSVHINTDKDPFNLTNLEIELPED